MKQTIETTPMTPATTEAQSSWRQRGGRRLTDEAALDPAKLVRVLKDYVRREGLEALNMRGVAAAAQVSPRLLYSKVRDKADMIRVVCEAIVADATPQTFTGTWQDRLREIAHVTCRSIGSYPGVSTWILRHAWQPITVPRAQRIEQEVRLALAEAGLQGTALAAAYSSFVVLTMGHLIVCEGAGNDEAALARQNEHFAVGFEQWLAGIQIADQRMPIGSEN